MDVWLFPKCRWQHTQLHLQQCTAPLVALFTCQQKPDVCRHMTATVPFSNIACHPAKQDKINQVSQLAHQVKTKVETLDKENAAAKKVKGQQEGSASERTRTTITAGRCSLPRHTLVNPMAASRTYARHAFVAVHFNLSCVSCDCFGRAASQ